MYTVCDLWLGPNFGVRLTAVKNFYLRLTVEKIHAFAVFTGKYLRSYGCDGTKFTAMVKCTNRKIEMQIEIIEIQVTAIQQKIFFLFSCELVCSQLIDLAINSRLLQPL